MRSNCLLSVIYSLLAAVIIVSCVSGCVSADDKISVSPSLVLNFSSVPDDIFNGGKVTMTASSYISDELKLKLKSFADFDVSNAAYAVNLAAESINLSSVSECSLYMPTSHEWNPHNNSVRAVVFSGDDFYLGNVSVELGNETVCDIYCVNLSSVPDSVVLVSGAVIDLSETFVPVVSTSVNMTAPVNNSAESAQTSSPLSVYVIIASAAAVVCAVWRTKK